MRTFIAAFIIIVGMSAAYASGMMLLHVGSANGNGGSSGACTGTIDLSEGCPQPMLGL